jgi:succinate dehydrogenase / fumarate reductase, cytochrome b subunit
MPYRLSGCVGRQCMPLESRLRPRPLSPHLAVYRRTMTMMMSIAHRTTGAALYFGTLLLIGWLISAAEGPKSYQLFETCITSLPGKFVLLCYTWALIHHLLGGLRHFAWDIGQGFDLPTANLMARATLIGSVILTILVWTVGTWMRGAL